MSEIMFETVISFIVILICVVGVIYYERTEGSKARRQRFPGLEYFEETGVNEEDWKSLTPRQREDVWLDLEENDAL